MTNCYDYPRPALTVDCVVFGLDEEDLKVLLIKRDLEPFAGKWALPGGFVRVDETLDEAARRELAEEAGRRWPIVRIAITHRIGLVEIGETSVAIAVSSAHRGEAFEACRFAIDRLKEIVPIWKKEHFEGGEVWVGCQISHPPHPDSPAGK